MPEFDGEPMINLDPSNPVVIFVSIIAIIVIVAIPVVVGISDRINKKGK